MKPTKVVVTGGAGFIGSHLALSLLKAGIRTVIYDNFSSGVLDKWEDILQDDNVEVIEGDIRNLEQLKSVCQSSEWVFHQAANVSVPLSITNPQETFQVNVQGSLNVLEAARQMGVQRVVLASSCAVYGNASIPPLRETLSLHPTSPYGASKAAMEMLAESYFHSYGLQTVCLRYFNVYGTGQKADSDYAAVIAKFWQCCVSGQQPNLYGDGFQTRDFIHVRDIVQANLLAANVQSSALKKVRVFNIGTGTATSLRELLSTLYSIHDCERELNPKFLPERLGDIRASYANMDRSRGVLGFVPEYNLRRGLITMMPDNEASLSEA